MTDLHAKGFLLALLFAGVACRLWSPRRTLSVGTCFALAAALWILTGFFTGLLGFAPAPILMLAGLGACGIARGNLTMPRLSRELPMRRLLRVAFLVMMLLPVLLMLRYMGLPVANYDVLSYHLPLAQSVARDGGRSLLLAPEIFYARMPVGAALLEAPVSQLHHTQLQAFLVLVVLATASCAGRVAALLGARSEGRALAVLLTLAHPMMLDGVLSGLVDPVVALLTLAAVECTLRGVGMKSGGWLAAGAGLLAGTAAAVKLSALGTAVAPVLLLAGGLAVARRRWQGAALVAAGLALALGPWLVRAVVLGGHPLFPFRGAAPDWTPEQGRFVVQVHEPLLLLSAEWWRHGLARLDVFGYTLAGQSVLLLLGLAAPLMLRHRAGWLLLLGALGGYAAFLGVKQNPARFCLPAIILLLPLVAAAWGMYARARPWRLLAGVLLLAAAAMDQSGRWKAMRGVTLEHDAERRSLLLGQYLGPALTGMAQVARDATPEGTLLLFFEARGALFGERAEFRTVWDQPSWAADLKASRDAADFEQRLYARGVRTVFVNEFEWGRLLDFYARQPGVTFWRNVGVYRARTSDDALQEYALYPPHRFAGLQPRDLEILHAAFVQWRQRTPLAEQAGPASQIWCARLQAVAPHAQTIPEGNPP